MAVNWFAKSEEKFDGYYMLRYYHTLFWEFHVPEYMAEITSAKFS